MVRIWTTSSILEKIKLNTLNLKSLILHKNSLLGCKITHCHIAEA